MTATDRYIEAPNLSAAWLSAVRTLYGTPGAKAVHLILRIADPTLDDETIRAEAQRLIDEWNTNAKSQPLMYDVLTTRNTLFPAAWAERHPEPSDLAEYYRERYPRLRSHDSGNKFGTYFGRIVAYPRESKHDDTGDQLTTLVSKLRQEMAGGSAKSSRYEVNIFSERYDTNPMSFPCLAHLSFHLHEGRLHQQAIYRNESLVGRAYGNYLGLAQLQCYVARACALQVGEFLATIGHAELDGHRRPVADMLSRFPAT